jgi:hypothetical protein
MWSCWLNLRPFVQTFCAVFERVAACFGLTPAIAAGQISGQRQNAGQEHIAAFFHDAVTVMQAF